MTIRAVDSRLFCTTNEQSSNPNISIFSLNNLSVQNQKIQFVRDKPSFFVAFLNKIYDTYIGKIFSLFLSCGLV